MITIALELELSVRDDVDGSKVVEVAGEIDLSTAHLLEAQLRDLTDSGTLRIIADLTRVAFIDSTGLAVLLAALLQLKEADGELIVTCVKGPVRRILAVSGADRRMTVREEDPHPSGPDAMNPR